MITRVVADLSFVDAMVWVFVVMLVGALALAALAWLVENWAIFATVAVIAVIAFPIWLIAKIF